MTSQQAYNLIIKLKEHCFEMDDCENCCFYVYNEKKGNICFFYQNNSLPNQWQEPNEPSEYKIF